MYVGQMKCWFLGLRPHLQRADLLQDVCLKQHLCLGRYIGISVSLQAGVGTGEESAVCLAGACHPWAEVEICFL